MTDATDDFERAAIGANWTQSTSLAVLGISGSTDVIGTSVDSGGWWNLDTFGSDQYSEVVVGTEGDQATDGGPIVRHQSGASTFYMIVIRGGDGEGQVYECTAGSYVALGAAYSGLTTTTGTTHRLDITGSTLTPSVNGSAQATRSDASITNGAPGIRIYREAGGFFRTYSSWLAGPISDLLPPVAITQTANPAGVTAVANVTTYSAAAIGTASPDRIVAVVIGKEVATVTVSSVTIGGVAAISAGGTTFGSMGAWIYYLGFPTGTTADIAVTWSGAITNVQNHIAVYAIVRASGPPSVMGTNTSTDMDATAPLTTGSTTIPANGGMLAVAVGATDTVAKTWANLTEDIDADAGDFRFTTATSNTAGAATRTCTGGTNGEDGVLAWATFSQTALPNSLLLMPTMMPPSRRI